MSSSSISSTTVTDDAELAFQLHRALNNSPRTSKNFCSTRSSFTIPKIWNCNGSLSTRVSGSRGYLTCYGKLVVCTTKKLAEDLDKIISELSVCLSASDDGSCIDLDHLKPGDMIDMRFSTRDKECQGNSEIGLDVDDVDSANCGEDVFDAVSVEEKVDLVSAILRH
ncbi:hypothetical protein F0562_019652 [Nyssa sinensis]|uniref:Uncharacterized protein n=1 Tax=Nyssa sinensis TaxID=561372 RepID=A0A5J5BP65_9ASTE|nr:hypothetical protein F0562_019652 [Nyssa sinensis]